MTGQRSPRDSVHIHCPRTPGGSAGAGVMRTLWAPGEEGVSVGRATHAVALP